MAWLEIHQSLINHRKTLETSDALDIKPVYLIGHLVSGWLWCLDNAPDGNLGNIKPRTFARACQWDDDPQVFFDALVAGGFIENTDGGFVVHDWWDYAGKLIERREQNRQRMCNARAQHVQNTCETRAPATVQYRTQQNRTEPIGDDAMSSPKAPTTPEKKPAPMFPEESVEHRLVTTFRGLLVANNPTTKAAKLSPAACQRWAGDFGKMIRLDGRDPPTIEAVMRWAQADTFWKANILSPAKLREKWDTLWLQMQRPPKEAKRNGTANRRCPSIEPAPVGGYTIEEFNKLHPGKPTMSSV